MGTELEAVARRPLEVSLRTAPVPQIVPAVLAPYAVPDRDEDGRLLDWKLNVLAVPDDDLQTTLAAFATFRTGYSQRAIVGDRGRLRMLCAWAASRELPVDALAAMDHADVTLDPATVFRLARQLADVGATLRSDGPAAVGWFTPGGVGLLGGALDDDLADGVTVSTFGSAVVDAHPDHLLVRGARHLAVAGADASAPVRVEGWELTSEGTVVSGDDVIAGDAGRALTLLAPGASRVRVSSVPATSVVAGLLTTLVELCQVAARSGRPVRVVG